MPESPNSTDFAQRLSKYGLTPQDVRASLLRVSRRSLIHLGSNGKKQSYHAPRLLKSDTIDELKSWIGVPNTVFKQDPKIAPRRAQPRLPPTSIIRSVEDALKLLQTERNLLKLWKIADELRKKLSEHRKELTELAYSFLYSNSEVLGEWRSVLTFHVADWLVPVWAYDTVLVEAGSVLEFGEGSNVLSARRLVVERGGTIRVSGGLTVDVSVITRSR